MPTVNEIREIRAELQKMMAEASDDKAFGMFSPGLQKKITETKKNLADLTVQLGKQRDLDKQILKTKQEINREQAKSAAEEQKSQRATLLMGGVAVAMFAKMEHSLRSLRDAGMANTVEAFQQETAYTLLGRQIAGVFLPATTASTRAMMWLSKEMSGLSEKGQDLIFVVATATTGLVAFSTVQGLAALSGMKLAGTLGLVARWLPLIGLAAGGIIALGALFLSGADGASTLNSELEKTVEQLEEISKRAKVMNNANWTEWLGIKSFEILESLGLFKKGTGGGIINLVDKVQDKEGRNKNKPRQPTPGNFRFENSPMDAWERVQLAAAKSSVGEKDKAQEQLDTQKAILEAIQSGVSKGIPVELDGGIAGGADY